MRNIIKTRKLSVNDSFQKMKCSNYIKKGEGKGGGKLEIISLKFFL
jgi:hypothetical protein